MNIEEAVQELQYAREMCRFDPTTGEVGFKREEDKRQFEAISMAIEALLVSEDTTSKSQEAKADAGKPDLTLVPRQIIWDIAEVREYGNKKYHSPDNWKQVELPRYRAAAFRHFLAYLENPKGKDAESGIEHYKHLACNLAFICEMEKSDGD